MSAQNREPKIAELPIEGQLSKTELHARLHIAALQLLDENLIPSSVVRGLELDIDAGDTGSAHQQNLRVQEIIGEALSEAESKLPDDIVKIIKYPPHEKPKPRYRPLTLPHHHIEQLIGRVL